MKIKFKKIHKNAKKPTQAHNTDAGFDLYCTEIERSINGDMLSCETGIAIEIPKGYWGDLRARSSISKTGLILSNGSGVIDEGYRGEITFKFNILSLSQYTYKIGDKIGQIIIRKRENIEFIEAKELNETERGRGGYGSTGR